MEEKIFDVKETASNCAYSLAGEGAGGSIIKTTDKVIEPGVEVSNYFHKKGLFTNDERTTDQQKEKPVQTFAVNRKTLRQRRCVRRKHERIRK